MKIKSMFSVVLLVLVGCSPLSIELEIDVNPNPAKVGEEVSIIVHEPEEAKGEFSTVGVMISWTDPETGSTKMQAFQDKQFEEEMIFVPDVPVPHGILAGSYSLTKQGMGFVTLTVNE